MSSRWFWVIFILAVITITLGGNFYLSSLFRPHIEKVSVSAFKASREIHPIDKAVLNNLEKIANTPQLKQILSRPTGSFYTNDLHVDQCEVRQGEFYDFVKWEKKYTGNKHYAHSQQPKNWKYMSSSEVRRIAGKRSAPASGVTFFDAHAYCRAAGGRLPTADEWNAISGGKESRTYPWGESFNPEPWGFINPELNSAVACGNFPMTDTPEGVHDLGAGVSEWNALENDSSTFWLSGGNGMNQPAEIFALSASRRAVPAQHRSPYTGFRCVYESLPEDTTPWGLKNKPAFVAKGLYATGISRHSIIPQLLSGVTIGNLEEIRRVLEGEESTDKGEDAFSFSRYEITREHYQRFLKDPFVRFGFFANKSEPVEINYTPFAWERQMENPQKSVTGIDWWSAYAFAQWAGGSLPTPEEWNQAYQYQNNTPYPWGEKFIPQAALTRENGLGDSEIPGSFPQDKTSAGIYDLVGNVSEWTSGITLTEESYRIIVKGGNFTLPGKDIFPVEYYRKISPHHKSLNIGLRIVFR